ncbi:MAG: exodeoxyribonuclease VII small subunit [Pirellulales bacterium]
MAKKRKVKRVVSTEKLSFEGALERLEAVVRQLESGQLPLAEALEQYEIGIRHLKTCYQLLERAERRIELLSRVDEEGNPVVEEFDESATLGPDGRKSRSPRQVGTPRRPKSSHENEIDDSEQLF